MLTQQEERVPSSFEPTVGWKATAVDKFCCTPNSKAHDAHMPTQKEDGTAPVRTFGTHFEQLWCTSNSWVCALLTRMLKGCCGGTADDTAWSDFRRWLFPSPSRCIVAVAPAASMSRAAYFSSAGPPPARSRAHFQIFVATWARRRAVG